MYPPARAGHCVQVMLDDRRGHRRDLQLLVRGGHPRSAAPARFAPHPHAPRGKCGTVRSGSSRQAKYDPGAPGCLPEFPDAARSSLASRSSSSPTRSASAAFCAASIAMSWPCCAISASRAASSAAAVTDHHHPASRP